jgi:proteic killer suppression protein
MSAASAAEYGPTCWKEWKIFLAVSMSPQRLRRLISLSYRLHPLKADLKGLWSVTVRANWRIIFRFEGVDVFDVELIDYH